MELKLQYSIVEIHSDGQDTTVVIEDENTGEVFTGNAYLNETDRFDIAVGSRIALRRALQKMFNASVEHDNFVDGNPDIAKKKYLDYCYPDYLGV